MNRGCAERSGGTGRHPRGGEVGWPLDCGYAERAVHDAGEISRIAPMGMIFVPSRGESVMHRRNSLRRRTVPTASKSSTARFYCSTSGYSLTNVISSGIGTQQTSANAIVPYTWTNPDERRDLGLT